VGREERDYPELASTGAEALRTVAVAWHVEPEWTAPLGNGFRWWARRLEQGLTYQDLDDDVHDLRAVTNVAAEVQDAAKAKRLLSKLNQRTGTFAFYYEAADHTVKAVTAACMTGWYQPTILWFAEAAMLQLCQAERWAEFIARSVGGAPASSVHPSGRRRAEPHHMLALVSSYRERPAWITGSSELVDEIEPLADSVQDELGIAAGEGLKEMARWPGGYRFPLDPPGDAEGAPFQVSVQSAARHPDLGHGLTLQLASPWQFPDEDADDIANHLNVAALTRSIDTKGAWWSYHGQPGFTAFLPTALLHTLAHFCDEEYVVLTEIVDTLARVSLADKPGHLISAVNDCGAEPKAADPRLPAPCIDASTDNIARARADQAIASSAARLTTWHPGTPATAPVVEPALIDADPTIVLAHFGTLNPAGPELSTLGLTQTGDGHYLLVHWLRRPHSPRYRAILMLPDLQPESLGTALQAVTADPKQGHDNQQGVLSYLPEFIDMTHTPDELQPIVTNTFRARAATSCEEAWTDAHVYEAYEGKTWSRPGGSAGTRQIARPPDDPGVAAARWWAAVSNPRHVKLHEIAFMSAWDDTAFQENGPSPLTLGYWEIPWPHVHLMRKSRTMSNEWPKIPDGTILRLKRRRKTSEREQWTVSGDSENRKVHRFWLENGGSWEHAETGTGFRDLADAVEHIPALRSIERGVISDYTLFTAAMDPPVLVGMLEVSAAGGAEAAGDWPAEIARQWADSDSSLEEWPADLSWVPRWAKVNDLRVSAINIGTADEPSLQPVLADEDEGRLVPIREIASSAWHSESGGAPISWDGGSTFSLLAPRLGYESQWGDLVEEWAVGYPFVYLREGPAGLGEAVADWVIEINSEVAAAFALEPFDVSGVLEDAERRAWDSGLAEVGISFVIDVDAETQQSLREFLARKSELYRRTRDGLASPRSGAGQGLARALDEALENGIPARLISGGWG
jgi:hypothetical protein